MQEVEESNAVRTILRSEITWLVSFIALIMGFVSTVVLPLQSLQIQLTAVQAQLADSHLYDEEHEKDDEKKFDKLNERVSTVERQTAKLLK